MTCNSVHEIGWKYTALASTGGTYFHLDSIFFTRIYKSENLHKNIRMMYTTWMKVKKLPVTEIFSFEMNSTKLSTI